MRIFNFLIKTIFIILIFVSTLSLPIRKTSWFDINSSLDWQLDPSKLISQIHATENDWVFVRQSASWARGNSTFIDQILTSLRDNKILSFNSDQVWRSQNLGKGKVFDIRIEMNKNYSITSGAYTGSKSFQNRFEIWDTSSPSNPALQLYFNSVTDLDETGALMYYNLAKLNPEGNFFDNNTNTVIETYIHKKPNTNGLRRQVYTWKNAPISAKSVSDSGRVVLDEVLEGSQLCFRTVVKVNRANLKTLTNNATLNGLMNASCGGIDSDPIYYTLAYMQKFNSPFLTTAKYGWTGGATKQEGFCALATTNKNYGLFDDKGFVRDTVAQSDVPSEYPSPNLGNPSVDSAFTRTYSIAEGANGSDDTSKAFIDAINSNGLIAFKASTPP
jgi:hypothetical protein